MFGAIGWPARLVQMPRVSWLRAYHVSLKRTAYKNLPTLEHHLALLC